MRSCLPLLFLRLLIIRDRCLYSTDVFHSGRTRSGVMFGLGAEWAEWGHCLNHESSYYYGSSSFRSAVIPNILSSLSDKSCWTSCVGDQRWWHWGHAGVRSYCATTWMLFEGHVPPSWSQLESSLDIPVCLFVLADGDVTVTRCFPSAGMPDIPCYGHTSWLAS